MKQTVKHIKVDTDGVQEEFLALTMKDKRWPLTPTEVELSIEHAMELHRLLGNKLGEIPA